MTFGALILIALLLSPSRADAAIFTVDTTADALDAALNGNCLTLANQCSLRAAIQEANAANDPDTIMVPAGTYQLSVDDADDNTPDLDLAGPVTITGAGPLATIIDANGTGGVFEVRASATLERLAITGADVPGEGGGVYAVPDATTLTLIIREARLIGNKAIHGGGLYADGNAQVVVERSSITGNIGTTGSGAVRVAIDLGEGASVTLRNTTVSDNTSGLLGDVVNAGTLVLEHVTMVDATIATDQTAIPAATTTIAGSILDPGPGTTVCVNPVVSLGNNLERGTSCALASAGDMSNVDPELGPLQDNGGGTLTRALPATSPAVDAAGACALVEDQRGEPRPLDGDFDTVAACDAGAYELDPGDQPSTSTTTTTTTTPSTTSTTLPGGCPSATTFPAVRCRLDALRQRVGLAGTAGSFRDRIVTSIGKADDKVAAAEAASASSAKKAKKLLKKAGVQIKKARAKIGSKKGQKTFTDATERGALQADADAARNALVALASTLG